MRADSRGSVQAVHAVHFGLDADAGEGLLVVVHAPGGQAFQREVGVEVVAADQADRARTGVAALAVVDLHERVADFAIKRRFLLRLLRLGGGAQHEDRSRGRDGDEFH